MKKIVQITKVLMTLRADPELEIAGAAFNAAPRVVRETSIPRAFLLTDVREKRTFRRLARKLAWFIALLVFYAMALLLDRNITTRYTLGQTLTKELLTTSLAPSGVTFASGIDDFASFWDWLSNALVPKVYTTTTSTGLSRTPDQLYMIGTRSKILGGFHIIQQRYLAINTSSPEHKNNMCYSTISAGKNLICYSTSGISTEPFGSLVSAGSSANETELQSLKMFQYSVNAEGVGGFQTYFLRSTTAGAAELARIERMRAYGWFDEQTQRIQITLPFYNIHLKMAGAVRMYVDSDLTGAITTSSTIHVMNTESYNLDVTENLIRFVYEIFYAVAVLSFAASELWGMLILAHGNFRKYAARHGLFETLSELVSIGTNVTVVVSRWAIMTSPKRTLINTASSFENYAPLTAFMDEDDIYIGLNMLNVFVLTTRVLKFFKVTNGGQRLLNSIASAMPDLLSFLPIYVTVIIAYAFGGHLLFGLTFAEWSTYSRALCRVVEMNFGLYDPGPIYDAGGVLGFAYTASASVIFCIIMLNVFMAIVMSTWDAFTEKEVAKAKIRERYREEMSYSELLGLVLLRESILDSLIVVLLRMDKHETITKALLEEHWSADGTRMPKWVRRRVLKWYWNSDDTAHVGPNAQHIGSGDTHNGAKAAPDISSQVLRTKSTNIEPLHQPASKRSITYSSDASAPEDAHATAPMKTLKYAPPLRTAPSFLRASAGPNDATATARALTGVPREFLVRDLKEKRKFRLLSRKLTVFVTFVMVYLSVLLLDRSITGRSAVRRIISTELIQTSHAASGITFAAINSVGSFWDWFINSFLVSVYSTTNSDGFSRSDDELYTIASHTKIIGGFHIRQTRYLAVDTSTAKASDDPCNSYLAPTVNQTCYSSASESTTSFGMTNGTAASAAELKTLAMFTYSVNNDSVGGFQTFFLRSATNGAAELATVNLMRAHRWIDRQTKLVEITMPMYNSNLKLWSIVNLQVAYDLAGGVTPKTVIHVANLEPYNLNRTRNVVRVVLEVIYVLHVVYFVLLEMWDVCVLSGGSVRTYVMKYGLVNNLGDWANVAINVAIIVWRYLCQSNSTRLSMLAITSFDEYVSALSLAKWDDVLLVLNVCNMLLLTGRALKYFQVTNGGRRLMNSVYGAMPEVLSFLPIYVSVLIGYAFVGHMLYGLSFPEWSTFPRAFFRVFEINFGLYDPGPIYDGSGYLSVVFIYTSNIVFCILMLNVFMAIVMSTWDNLSEREAERATERAQFARKLGPIDLAFLISMSEDVVDLLIDVATTLDDCDMVTKQRFSDAWTATGVDVSAWTWANVCSWYWDDKSPDLRTAVGLPDTVDKLRSKTIVSVVSPSLSSPSPVKQPDGARSDDLVVIQSARSLDLSSVLKSVKASSGKPSAKVFAADIDSRDAALGPSVPHHHD